MDRDDDDNFLAAMQGVKPIDAERRAPKSHRADRSPGAKRRREAACEEAPQEFHGLAGGGNAYANGIEQVEPAAILNCCRDGIQNNVFRKLKLGKYVLEARLDLHHQTVEQARRQVFEFVRDCREHDMRCALITHGKGEGRELPARLKSCVAHWLPQMDEVLAFHSAQPQHGGAGATYILLRKALKRAEDFY